MPYLDGGMGEWVGGKDENVRCHLAKKKKKKLEFESS